MGRARRAVAGLAGLATGVALGVTPVAAAAAPATTAPAHLVHPLSRVSSATGSKTKAAGWESTNWSGYAATGSGITSASGTWVVPTVTASKSAEYSASWVGVDGYSNSNLIQTGTGQDTSNGKTSYYAWWEVLPAAETEITTVTVHPGDNISASVAKVSGTTWKIVLDDTTTGKDFSTTVSYSGPGTSAEWIEEAPTVGGGQSTLADFHSVTFANAAINGANANLNSSEAGDMVNSRGSIIAEPGNPNATKNGFTDSYV